jgi:microcin C transport system substrate-binding protein
MGIKNPVVDALVDMVINAPTQDELISRTRALDRVLLWGYYAIPQWHINVWRVAHWDKFGKPSVQAPYALGALDTWWVKQGE